MELNSNNSKKNNFIQFAIVAFAVIVAVAGANIYSRFAPEKKPTKPAWSVSIAGNNQGDEEELKEKAVKFHNDIIEILRGKYGKNDFDYFNSLFAGLEIHFSAEHNQEALEKLQEVHKVYDDGLTYIAKHIVETSNFTNITDINEFKDFVTFLNRYKIMVKNDEVFMGECLDDCLKKNNYSVGIKFVQAKKNDYLYEIIRDQLKQKKS